MIFMARSGSIYKVVVVVERRVEIRRLRSKYRRQISTTELEVPRAGRAYVRTESPAVGLDGLRGT
jgi:hypothetical protein